MLTPSARKKPLTLSCRGSAERFIAERSLSWAKKGKLATLKESTSGMNVDYGFTIRLCTQQQATCLDEIAHTILDRSNNYQVHDGPHNKRAAASSTSCVVLPSQSTCSLCTMPDSRFECILHAPARSLPSSNRTSVQ